MPSTQHQLLAASPRTPATPPSWHARFGLALFAAVLGFVYGPGLQDSAFCTFAGSERPAQASVVFGPAGLLLQYTPPTQGVSNTGGGASAPGAQDRSSSATAVIRTACRSAYPAGVRIQRTAAGSLVALRRCVLIFPFHCFW